MSAGGKRDNAGRKAIPQEEKRVQTTISVAPETRQRISLLRKKGVIIGRQMDILVEMLCKQFGVKE